jgi:drug/metabolite transporter (DMT)-like permease
VSSAVAGAPPDRRTPLLATLALLAITACWGSTFFLIKDLLDRVPVLDFIAVRFALASVSLCLLFPRALGRLTRRSVERAVALGAVYGVAQILQTAGLADTPASVSGFITGLYVVCTPVFAAVASLAVLTLSGFSVGFGEAITLVSALLYALHIVGLGAWSDARQAMGMSIVQLMMITVVALSATVWNGIDLPSTGRDWLSVVYMAVFAGALCLAGQTWAQAHLAPTRAAIIMSMEPVFAALFAVVLGGEPATSRMILGGLMVLGAMLLAELAPRRRIEAEVPHIAV